MKESDSLEEALLASLQRRIPEARLELQTLHGISLWLLNPDFPRRPLAPEVAAACWEQPPYWAFVWPGGNWLSEWLPSQRPRGKIVDLGCGSGVLSIALARAGCQVVAVDSDPEARLACAINCQLNGVTVEIFEKLEDVGDFQWLVLADFLYDPANLSALEQLRSRCQQLVLADCRLRQLPPEYECLARARRRILPDLDWGNEFDEVWVAGWSARGPQ